MNLLIDLGNSRLKWALAAGERWQAGTALSYTDDLTAQLDAAWAALAIPHQCLLVSVAAAPATACVQVWVKQRWNLSVRTAQAMAAQLGVSNGYEIPERLGADRWVALIAAHQLVEGPVVIVDCGTALTLDALSAEGKFLGGVILPGLSLSRQALYARASGIREIHGDAGQCLARNTRDGVAAGTLFGLAGAIERIVQEQQKILGPELTVLLTGGDASVLAGLLSALPYRLMTVPDLVLKGLAAMAEAGA